LLLLCLNNTMDAFLSSLADGDDDEDADTAAGDDAADADAHPDAAAAAAAGQPDAEAAAAAGAGNASAPTAQQQQLGRADSAADSSAYWSTLLKPRWEVLRRDELEGLELHQVGVWGVLLFGNAALNAIEMLFLQGAVLFNPAFVVSQCSLVSAA
jgi:hypothetical protein